MYHMKIYNQIGRALTILLLLLFIAACTGTRPTDDTAATASCDALEPGDPVAGEEVFYRTLEVTGARGPRCVSCHAVDSDVQENVGPGLQGIAAVAASRVPDQSAAQYLCISIVAPREHIVEGYPDDIVLMPVTYSNALSQQQLNDLVAYMLTLE